MTFYNFDCKAGQGHPKSFLFSKKNKVSKQWDIKYIENDFG